ncbi:MAG: nucleoside hydrolase [Bacteroidota bacterium]
MSQNVIMEHDGAIDDLLSQLLLSTMNNKKLIGVNVTPADCFIGPAVESTYKMLQFVGEETVPIGRCDFNGINAFPNEWRARPEVINALPMLINLPKAPDPYSLPNSIDLLVQLLEKSEEPVEILITGPCSNLVMALERAPHLKSKIKEVVWMAGAFRTQGNVQTYQHNGTAEWNVYWDPVSTAKLMTFDLPILFIPLDVTNQVPVNKDFLSTLAQQMTFPMSHLAGQLWAMTIDTIPSYHYVYFMWDMLATSYLGIPDAFTVKQIKAKVSVHPPNAGQTYLDEAGYTVRMASAVNKSRFYDYVLHQFKR